MNLCDTGHEEVCYRDGVGCPVCEAIAAHQVAEGDWVDERAGLLAKLDRAEEQAHMLEVELEVSRAEDPKNV